MPAKPTNKPDPALVASMMDIGESMARVWHPNELGAILRHQMSAPVGFDLSNLSRGSAARVQTLCAAEGLLVRSFADLFDHPHPPIELLRMVKDFAKAVRTARHAVLPPEIASLLYYLSIATALTRCGMRITSLSDKDLAAGLDSLLRLTWLDDCSRRVLAQAQDLLAQRAESKS